jgi:hypothetical protein
LLEARYAALRREAADQELGRQPKRVERNLDSGFDLGF